jgi:deoxyribose-phosphate aldolase
MQGIDAARLASMIDQTLLKPTFGLAEGAAWIEENATQGFAALCVTPQLVPAAARALSGVSTRVCSVCGFPLGYTTTESKAAEAANLVALGCEEVDMVVALGPLLEGDTRYVSADIAAVVAAVREASGGAALTKVILETGYLSEEQISLGCRLAEEAGADFVKTSTGFGPRGASVRDVELVRAMVDERLGIKAAGGIRDLAGALALVDAGATRLGTSAGASLLSELAARE